ncbi:MAG: ATP-binding protein [Bacteroidia bacterium]|jgi:signal transduction histidine kinase
MNIRIRLAVIFTIIVTIILIIFSVTVYQFYAIYRESNYFSRLKEKAYFNAKLILDKEHVPGNPYFPNKEYSFNESVEQSCCIYNIRNERTDCIGIPFEIPEKTINLVRRLRDYERMSNDTQYIGIEVRHKTGEYIVLASGYDGWGFKKLDILYQLILSILSGSLLISGFAGWWFANVSLRPMQEVMREVDEITATNLHKRVRNRNTRDEIDQLVNTFNQMLGRIENSFMMEKSLVANASHEYRTPLTAMKGQIEVALMQDRSKEDYLQLIKSVQEEINRMIKLQESLSELIKATTKHLQARSELHPLLDIIADARTTILQSKPDYRISLYVKDFPADQEEGMIVGDYPLLQSVFMNLMDNGCKFSPDHSVAVNIRYAPYHIITSVSDNGMGINEADLANIFNPFYRSNEVRDVYGHGLGLALVKRIIDIHHGTVEVKTEVGKGTTFIISLNNLKSEYPYYV